LKDKISLVVAAINKKLFYLAEKKLKLIVIQLVFRFYKKLSFLKNDRFSFLESSNQVVRSKKR